MSSYRDYGFVAAMHKPYTLQDLQATLETVITPAACMFVSPDDIEVEGSAARVTAQIVRIVGSRRVADLPRRTATAPRNRSTAFESWARHASRSRQPSRWFARRRPDILLLGAASSAGSAAETLRQLAEAGVSVRTILLVRSPSICRRSPTRCNSAHHGVLSKDSAAERALREHRVRDDRPVLGRRRARSRTSPPACAGSSCAAAAPRGSG